MEEFTTDYDEVGDTLDPELTYERPADKPKKFLNRSQEIEAWIRNPVDPQIELANTSSPLAPFPINAIKWASNVYDDGTTYEGQTCYEVPHGLGIEITGFQGGPTDELLSSKYEGEYHSGFRHGLGQQSNPDQTDVYIGQFEAGLRHGCGARYNFQSFKNRVEEGENMQNAWKKVWPRIKKNALYGTWVLGRHYSDPIPEEGQFECSIREIRAVEREAREVVKKARMFQWKPYGEVVLRFTQLEGNVPAPIMQNPTLYPFETGWMAPGPVAQLYPLPDDKNLKFRMKKRALEHMKIHNRYNFDLVPKPGSDQWLAETYFDAIANNFNFELMSAEDRVKFNKLEPQFSHDRENKQDGTDQWGIFGYFAQRREWKNRQNEEKEERKQQEKEEKEERERREKEDSDLYLTPGQSGGSGASPYASISQSQFRVHLTSQFFQHQQSLLSKCMQAMSQGRPRLTRPRDVNTY